LYSPPADWAVGVELHFLISGDKRAWLLRYRPGGPLAASFDVQALPADAFGEDDAFSVVAADIHTDHRILVLLQDGEERRRLAMVSYESSSPEFDSVGLDVDASRGLVDALLAMGDAAPEMSVDGVRDFESTSVPAERAETRLCSSKNRGFAIVCDSSAKIIVLDVDNDEEEDSEDEDEEDEEDEDEDEEEGEDDDDGQVQSEGKDDSDAEMEDVQ
jgi:hypothetical protein